MVVNTPYKCVRSRKNTAIDDNNIPTPKENINTNMIGIGTSSNVHRKGSPVAVYTSKKAAKEKKRLTIEDNIRERGNMYFGTYTFLMVPAPPTTDPMARFVDSLKKLNITCPLNTYMGKFGICT